LRLRPDYERSQLVLSDAFRSAINQHESRITQLKLSPEPFKGDDSVHEREQIVREYETVIRLQTEVKSLPRVVNPKTKQPLAFEFKEYSAALAEAKERVIDAREKAAEMHYQKGIHLSNQPGVNNQKAAAKEFARALESAPNYKDAAARYEVCREVAIRRMAIIPFENKSGKTKYGAIGEMITDQIISEVMNDREAMEFLEIISRDQLERVLREQSLGLTGVIDERTAAEIGNILGVHEILTGQITQVISADPQIIRRTQKEKGSAVVGQRQVTDKKGKVRREDVWGDVFANVIFYTKRAGAKINGSYKIIEVKTAKLIKSQMFSGSYDFSCEWATFTGDERALSRSSRDLVSKMEEAVPPDEERVCLSSQNLARSLSLTLKEHAK
jgi:TolB-like protein